MRWFFAHGSLMFDRPVRPDRTAWATVDGWERRFGHPSVRRWGSVEAPAPTCCLVPGGSVTGVLLAFEDGSTALEAFRSREASEPIEVRATLGHERIIASTWPMSSVWADRDPTALAESALRNRMAGGGPAGDAVDYLAGVVRALESATGLDAATEAYRAALG